MGRVADLDQAPAEPAGTPTGAAPATHVGPLAGRGAELAEDAVDVKPVTPEMDPGKVQLLKGKLAKARASVLEATAGGEGEKGDPVHTPTRGKKGRKKKRQLPDVRGQLPGRASDYQPEVRSSTEGREKLEGDLESNSGSEDDTSEWVFSQGPPLPRSPRPSQ